MRRDRRAVDRHIPCLMSLMTLCVCTASWGQELTSDTPAATEQAGWQQGMAYWPLRRDALAAGWLPTVAAQCRADVVGAHHRRDCEREPALCKVCDDLPELQSCGSGHCLMRYERADGNVLEVHTYGDVYLRDAAGKPYDLLVIGWSTGN